MWSMIKAEFNNIRHNRLLLISTLVICLIPFLYSIFFLKSVWDPYGSTENLPVAVVNKDIPVEYQGKTMNVGQQMVDELRRNKQLKWEIVSPKKAQYGLSHRQYYTVVTIPKDFSKDATTVLEKHPTQMKLKYETNGSLNYIGQVISQLGMTKLNQKIRAQVTEAYANVMFKALQKVGKGMNTAASGSQQLSNGLMTLQDGMNQYVAGVSQVNNGVQTLKMGVAPLAAGAQQLAAGSATLQNGIAQYTGGVGQLGAGLNQLMANSKALNDGASQLNSGAGQLATGANQLNGAVNSSFGNIDFNGIMGAMNQADQLKASLGQLQGGLTQAKAALAGVQDSAGKLQQAAGTLSGVANAGNQLNGVADNDGAIVGLAQEILKDDKASDKSKSYAQQIMAKAGTNVKTIQGLSGTLGQLNTLSSSLSGMQQQLGQLSQMSTVLDNADGTLQQANQLLNTLNGYKGQLANMPDQAKQLQSATAQLSAGATKLQAGSGTLQSGIGQYTAGVAQAGAGAAKLNANSGALNSGAGQLAGALGQLNAQVPTLTAGINQLAAGTQQLVDNSPQLTQGIVKLNAGASQLATALTNGARQMTALKPNHRTAKMIAEPSVEKHKNYSYVPNYGHALAPYVLSVALYVGMLVFNFVYPIRRVADSSQSATAWWASKVVVGGLAAIAMAVVECAIMMLAGLTVDHVPSFFLTTMCFGLASMAVVMFLSMTFDNPGRFLAMVLLMLQLGASGGTFPMEVTMKFYNVIHWYMPMTYSILGLRDSISGGLGAHYTMFCNLVLLGIAVVFNLLLWLSMKGIASHNFHAPSVASNAENEHGPMGKDDGFNSDDQ